MSGTMPPLRRHQWSEMTLVPVIPPALNDAEGTVEDRVRVILA